MLEEIHKNVASRIQPHQELTVLVVDPDPARRLAVNAMLQELEMVKTTGVRNTHHFLVDALTENSIDVILFDEGTGLDNIFDAVREVRIHPSGEDIGFVVAAERPSPELRKKGAQVGVLGFLQKPFGPQELQGALARALGEVEPQTRVLLTSMRDSSFFSSFSDRELLRLLNMCNTFSFGAEAPIFKDGEDGETMYVVLSGRVSIRKRFDGEVKELAVIQPGDTFGEMAILDNFPRSADAVAAQESTVFEINHAMLQEDDSLLALKLSRQIAIMLAHKIRAFNYR